VYLPSGLGLVITGHGKLDAFTDKTSIGAGFSSASCCGIRGANHSKRKETAMQQPDTTGVDERTQLQEKAWVFAQRGVVLLVAMLAGLLIGYKLWGQAGALKEQVTQLEERVNLREKERDTLKSQMAIIDRDKKEVEKRLLDVQARCAAPTEANKQ
jgi:hypothetical protein